MPAVAWSRMHCGHVSTMRFPGLQERVIQEAGHGHLPFFNKEEIGHFASGINDEMIATKALQRDRALGAKTIQWQRLRLPAKSVSSAVDK